MIHAHDAATPGLERRRLELVAAPALAAIAVAGLLIGPRAAPVLLVALAAAPAMALLRSGGTATAALRSPLPAAAAAFGCYITLNASWSADRSEAYGKVLFYWVAAMLAASAIGGLRQLGDRTLERMQLWFAAAAALGAVLLLFEVLSGALLGRMLFSAVPAVRPDPKHIRVADGWVTMIQPYMLNRNVAALCFVIWPCLIALRNLKGARGVSLFGMPLIAAVCLAVLRSDHATSALALGAAALTLAGMIFAATAMRRLIVVAWTAAALLAAPMAALAFEQGLQLAQWLPQTARNRIILWGTTAGEIAKAPLLGIGVAATRKLDAARAPAARPEGYTYPLRTGRHAHNVFLQTWYELGAIGAVLLLALGIAAIRALWALPASDQPLAFASFTTVVTIGAASWGMWQTWFMAAYAIWAVLLALVLEGARRARLRGS